MNFIFSLVVMEITGMFFVLFLFGKPKSGWPCVEFLPLSFFMGMSLVVYQLFLYHLLNIEFTFLNIIIVPAIMFIMLFSRYAPRPARLRDLMAQEGEKQKWSMTEKLLFLGITVQVLWVLLLVFPVPVHSHDAVANYALKAKIFFLDGGIPPGFFSWNEATVAHPDYPVFLPLLLTWIYCIAGFNDLVVNMIMPVVYLAFLGLFFSQMKRLFGRKLSLLMTFILATIPQVADYATIVHADLILAALVACAFGYFVIYIRTGERKIILFSSVLFGVSLWVKNEAVVWTAAFVLASMAYFLRKGPSGRGRALRDVIFAFLIIAVIAAPWAAVRMTEAAGNSDIDFSLITPERMLQNVKDIPVLLDLFQQEVFGPKKWNIFWVLVFAVMIWKRKILAKNECFYVTMFLAVAVLGYFAGYMATTGNNLYFYVNTTISRFMLHFTGVSLLLLAFLVRDDVPALWKG